MTVSEAIADFRDTCPCQIADDTLTSWLSEIELTVICEIILTHEGAGERERSFRGFSFASDSQKELSVKPPYSKLYTDYLRMKHALTFSDITRYNNASAIFASSLADFADCYNRTHMPLSAVTEFRT